MIVSNVISVAKSHFNAGGEPVPAARDSAFPQEQEQPVPAVDKEVLYREDWDNVQRAIQGDMVARNWLLQQVTPLIRQVTSVYCASSPCLEGDALSAAWIGVEKAMKNYRPGIAKFTTHAGWYIRGHISDVIRESIQVVRRPSGQRSRANALLKAAGAYGGFTRGCISLEGPITSLGTHARKPLTDPIRAAVAMIAPDLSLELPARSTAPRNGTSSEYDDDGMSLKDVLCAPENDHGLDDDRQYFFQEALRRSLTARQRHVVSAYFGLAGQAPQTLEEIAKPLSITRERVRQILHRTLKHLRSMIEKAEARREIGMRDQLSFMRPRSERNPRRPAQVKPTAALPERDVRTACMCCRAVKFQAEDPSLSQAASAGC